MAAAKRKSTGRRYGKAAGKSVERAMKKRNAGTLKSGAGRHPKVESREHAIAIGLNEAREAGAKVPSKRTGARKKSGAKKSGTKRASAKKSGGRKTAAKKSGSKRASSSRKKTSSKRSS
jgi:hypothetical protein